MSTPSDMNISAILLESHAPALIGIFLSVLLYGIQIVQSFIYYDTYRNDPVWMKCFVAFLLIADLLHAISGCGWVFRLMILNFGDLEAWAYADWLIRMDPAMGGFINAACQLFFAWRIHILTKNYFISGFIAILAALVLAGGLGIGIRLTWHNDLRQQESFKSLVILWLLPGMVADVVITITLTYFLRRRYNGFKKTDTMINRIIRLTLQNCLLTTLVATGDLAAFLATPKGYHIGFSFLVPKLYSNSVLSSLNSRSKLRGLGTTWESHISTPPHIALDERNTTSAASQMRRQEIYSLSNASPQPKVYIDVETAVVRDSDNTDAVKGGV